MPSQSSQDPNAQLGMRLFVIYSVFYFGFVLVNAFAAHWAEWEPIAGLNLAILWGFALIGLAFLLALIYGLFCTSPSDSGQDASSEEPRS